MRIDANQPYLVTISGVQPPAAVTGSATTTAAATAPATAGKFGGDRVVISAKSREIDRLSQQLSALPDVRLDKVALAKQQLRDGSLGVDAGVLARKMLESAGKG